MLHTGKLSGQRAPIDAEIHRQSASVKRQSDGAGTVWLLVHGKKRKELFSNRELGEDLDPVVHCKRPIGE